MTTKYSEFLNGTRMEKLKQQLNDPKYNNDFSKKLLEARVHFDQLYEVHGRRWKDN